jgi:DNA replication protein DnaC
LEERKVCRQEADKRSALHSLSSFADVRAGTDQTADASGSKPSRFQNDVHYVLGSPGTGKSHLAQAIGQAVIGQGYKVIYREAHILLEEIAEAALDGNRKEHMELLATVPLLIIDDLGMRKLGPTAGEELLEIVMRRYERASTLLTSNRPVEDWGKLLGDSAAVTAMLDRLLHHGHILKCGPRSWRTKTELPDEGKAG